MNQVPLDFKRLFESIPGLYLVLSPDFTIVAVSDAYNVATMTKRQEILHRNLFEVFPDNPNDPNATGTKNLKASFERALKHRMPDTMAVLKYDIRRPESEGGGFEERYWSPSNSPVFSDNGELQYFIHRAEDVTKLQKEIESHRIAEEKKIEALQIKSQFVSVVSHELRTPLTVIKGGIDLMTDGALGPVNAEQKDILETVKNNMDRLSRLINDVLDYQKLDSGHMKFHFAEKNLNSIVEKVANDFQVEIGKKKLTLSRELPSIQFKVECDEDKIIQVLYNFMNNAIKFMEAGNICVRIEPAPDNSVKVIVQDEGVGIKEEDKKKLFQSFSQLDSFEKRKTGGTGLGLSISKRIIEAHEGQIGMDSVFGEGSTFYFILKLKR